MSISTNKIVKEMPTEGHLDKEIREETSMDGHLAELNCYGDPMPNLILVF